MNPLNQWTWTVCKARGERFLVPAGICPRRAIMIRVRFSISGGKGKCSGRNFQIPSLRPRYTGIHFRTEVLIDNELAG